MQRRRKAQKNQSEDMPVIKNGPDSKLNSRPESPKPRTSESPVNANMDNRHVKRNSSGLPLHVKKADGNPRSRDSSNSSRNGKSKSSDGSGDIDQMKGTFRNGGNNDFTANGTPNVDLNGNNPVKTDVSGSSSMDGGAAKVDGTNLNFSSGGRSEGPLGNKGGGQNGFKMVSKVFNSAKVRGGGSYPMRSAGFRGAHRPVFPSNAGKAHKLKKPDELIADSEMQTPVKGQVCDLQVDTARNGESADACSSENQADQSEPREDIANATKVVSENDQPTDLQTESPKIAPAAIVSSSDNDNCTHEVQADPKKSNEKEFQAMDNAIIKKYCEEPLSFFQPDLDKANELDSPSVEELCAKWPTYSCNPPMDAGDHAMKDGEPSDTWDDRGKTAQYRAVVNSRYISKSSSSSRPPRFAKQRGPYRVDGSADEGTYRGDNSSNDDRSSAGSSLNVSGRQSGDSGYNTLRNGRPGSPRNPPPGFALKRTPERPSSDGSNRNPYYHSMPPRGRSVPQNTTGWGGMKRNKSGKKFSGQNGHQGEEKHFARLAQDKNFMGHGKAGSRLGYQNNHDAYLGQNLVIPPLMDQQVTQVNPLQMMSAVGPMEPQTNPMQLDEQYTLAVFPNGQCWLNVGGQENPAMFQPNGEVVPLTMGNFVPYVVPYNAGIPNTGVPLMIPAVAPLSDVGAQNHMNGQGPACDQALQMSVQTDPSQPNNSQLYSSPLANYGVNYVGNSMGAQPVSAHVGPIPAYSEEQSHSARPPFRKPWECASPLPYSLPTGTPPIQPLINNDTSHANTPEPNGQHPSYPSVSPNDEHSTPGTPLNATSSTTGTPGTPAISEKLTPATPQNAIPHVVKEKPNIKMMSVSQIERMQRMSSANGKRVPINPRSRDSPNHVPPAPQEVQEELVKFVCDSWNKVNQEFQKGSSGVAYYDSDPCPLEGFVPFDLEAYWGKRLVQNMTSQNIPTQNM